MMPARPGPVAIVAGSGQLPLLLAQSLDRTGRDHRILALRGFAEPPVRKLAAATVDLLDVQGALDILERWNPAAIMLAGGVDRPGPSAVLNAFSAVRNRRELNELIGRGDDSLLRGVLDLLTERGHVVAGVHEIAPQLLAKPGIRSVRVPDEGDARAVEIGARVLGALSPFDFGQAAVLEGERVLAVEGPEGTDRMLARVRGLRAGWMKPREKRGVLIKAAKIGQDLRIDLPAIGPRTIQYAARAGLAGVAVGASSTLILDEEETIATANRLGLFLQGIDLEGLAGGGGS